MSSGGVAVYARTFFTSGSLEYNCLGSQLKEWATFSLALTSSWNLWSLFDPISSRAMSEIVISFSTASSGLANKPKVKASLGARFVSLGLYLVLDLGLIILYCCISFLMAPNWQFLIFCCLFLVGLSESIDKYYLFCCYCSYLNWHVWVNGCKW